MCALCSSDEEEKRAERERVLRIAQLLQELSGTYESLAYGKVKPHTDDFVKKGQLARSVIRLLVDEWV